MDAILIQLERLQGVDIGRKGIRKHFIAARKNMAQLDRMEM